MRVKDNGGNGNGGIDTSDPQSFLITVAKPSPAPSLNDAAILSQQGASAAWSLPTANSSKKDTRTVDQLLALGLK